MAQAEWLLESQKDVQLLPGPESGHEHPDNWSHGRTEVATNLPGVTEVTLRQDDLSWQVRRRSKCPLQLQLQWQSFPQGQMPLNSSGRLVFVLLCMVLNAGITGSKVSLSCSSNSPQEFDSAETYIFDGHGARDWYD